MGEIKLEEGIRERKDEEEVVNGEDEVIDVIKEKEMRKGM